MELLSAADTMCVGLKVSVPYNGGNLAGIFVRHDCGSLGCMPRYITSQRRKPLLTARAVDVALKSIEGDFDPLLATWALNIWHWLTLLRGPRLSNRSWSVKDSQRTGRLAGDYPAVSIPSILCSASPIVQQKICPQWPCDCRGRPVVPIDGGGLASWTNQLNQNVSRAQVDGAILNSNEYLSREISTDYHSLLGRDPDLGGLLHFMQARQSGVTPQQVQAGIMGSDEFFARVSGDLTSFLQAYGGASLPVGSVARRELTAYRFLNAAYGEVLNRPVDATGLAAWFPLAGDAAGRTQFVSEVEARPEATERVVSTIYEDILGRTPDTGGLAYWAGQLQQSVSDPRF